MRGRADLRPEVLEVLLQGRQERSDQRTELLLRPADVHARLAEMLIKLAEGLAGLCGSAVCMAGRLSEGLAETCGSAHSAQRPAPSTSAKSPAHSTQRQAQNKQRTAPNVRPAQPRAAQRGPAQPSGAQRSPAQPIATQRNPAQPSPAQPSAAQLSPVPPSAQRRPASIWCPLLSAQPEPCAHAACPIPSPSPNRGARRARLLALQDP